MYCSQCQQSTLINEFHDQNQSKIPEGTRRYREQYISNQNDELINKSRISNIENQFPHESFVSRSLSPFEFGASTTSFASPSTTSLIPMRNFPPQRSLSFNPVVTNNSILVRAYSRQIQPI